MDKENDKRVTDGPITTSMRSDPPSAESIDALRERYALFDKMTAKKPAESFDSVLSTVGREGQAPSESSPSPASDGTQGDALPSDTTAARAAAERDTFERAPQAELGRKAPLPSGRHPDTPRPGSKSKVIIKV